MYFSPDVFDAKTIAELKKMSRERVDVFGETVVLRCERPANGRDILSILKLRGPMRAAHIAAILETDRDTLDAALASMVRGGALWRDEEAFYHSNVVGIH